MAANNRGTMRPNGRSPPFLAIGLVVALIILGFNYWNLSAKNGEQANEIAVVESEMRLINAKRTAAEKKSEAIADKVKDLEAEINRQKNVIAEKIATIATLNEEKETMRSEINDKFNEVQKVRNEELTPCYNERDRLQSEVETLKGQLETEKTVPKQTDCDQTRCSDFIQAARDLALQDVNQAAGVNPILQMYKLKMNVGKFSSELEQLAQQNVGVVDANHPVVEAQQGQAPAGVVGADAVKVPDQVPADKDAAKVPDQVPADKDAAKDNKSPNARVDDNVDIPEVKDTLASNITESHAVNNKTLQQLLTNMANMTTSTSTTTAATATNTAATATTNTSTKSLAVPLNGEGAETLKKDEKEAISNAGNGLGDKGEGDDDAEDKDYDDDADIDNEGLKLEKEEDEEYNYEEEDEDYDKYDKDDKDNKGEILKEENGIDEMQMKLENDELQ